MTTLTSVLSTKATVFLDNLLISRKVTLFSTPIPPFPPIFILFPSSPIHPIIPIHPIHPIIPITPITPISTNPGFRQEADLAVTPYVAGVRG